MRKASHSYEIALAILACSFVWSSAAFAQKHAALKAIDPSKAEYDTPPPAPPPPAAAQAPSLAPDPAANPFGSGIQGRPLGAKRTLANPNPAGAGDDPDAGPGIPTGAGQGWSPPSGDNSVDERRLTTLEKITFGSSYPEHEVDDRLDHLETEVFNKKFTGMPADQRLSRLEARLLGQTAFSGGAPGAAAPPSYGVGQGAVQPPVGRPYNPVMQPQFNPMPPQQYSPGPGPGMAPPASMGQPAVQSYMGQNPQMTQPPYMGQPSMGQQPVVQQQGWNQRPPAGSAPVFGGQQGMQAPPSNIGVGQAGAVQSVPPYMVPQGGGMPPAVSRPQFAPQNTATVPPYMGQPSTRAPQQFAGQQSAPPYMGQPQVSPYMGQAPAQATPSFGGQSAPPAAPFTGQQQQQSLPPYMVPPSGAATPIGQLQQMPQGATIGQSQQMGQVPPMGQPQQTPQGPLMGQSQQMPQGPPMGQSALPSTPYGLQQTPPTSYIAQQAPPSPAPAPYMAAPVSAQTAPPFVSSAPPQSLLQDPASAQASAAAFPRSRSGLTPADRANADINNIIKSIPEKSGAGDYFANISKFTGGSVARWTNFPVLIHLPMGSPANWHKTLQDSVESWGKFIPVRVAQPSETADIEIAWINHLPPRSLGQTNLEVFNGRMRVTVYLLRPSYYLPNTSDKTLRKVAEHEVGHAIGIFGHSSDARDLMFAMENANPKDATKSGDITPRDLNTLRKIYESNPLPPGFQSAQPMGWSCDESQKRARR